MKEQKNRTNGGFTLIEMAVVVVIVGAIAAMAIPAMSQMTANQRLRNFGMTLSGAVKLARSEAIRTGNIHIVFVGLDTKGDELRDDDGTDVPVLVLDDGRPGSVKQNCEIDSFEITHTVSQEPGVTLGVTNGATAAPDDFGAGDIATGSSFLGPDTLPASWVLFRPEGTPLSFDVDCNTGAMGSGAGAFYMTNGTRNVGVVLTPMGAVRLHGWSGGWSE